MKHTSVSRIASFILASLVSTSISVPALALPTSLPAKKVSKEKPAPAATPVSRSATKKSVPAKSKLATTLPAYRGKKRVTVTYDKPSETQVVIISDGNATAPPAAPQIVLVKPTPAPALEPALEAVRPPLPTEEIVNMGPPLAPAPDAENLATAEPIVNIEPTPAVADTSEVTPTLAPRSASPIDITNDRPTMRTQVIRPSERNRIVSFESGYLAARYDHLANDLKNGASTMTLGIELPIDGFAFRANLDVAHGLDQSVSAQNTRMIALRGGVFAKHELPAPLSVYGGASLGYVDLDVRSYRAVNGSDITVREHAKGSAFAVVPELGAQGRFTDNVMLQVAVRGWLLAGAAPLSQLGGLAVGIGLGFAL